MDATTALFRHLANICHLGVKELWSLWRDPMMLGLVVYAFTASVYVAATAKPETLNRAALGIVDEDRSALSQRIAAAFMPPQFAPPPLISTAQVDAGLDTGAYTFVLQIPPGFQRDVLAGRPAALQLDVDATRMSQAFSGNNYIQQIAAAEITEFVQHYRGAAPAPAELVVRARFNASLTEAWFGALMEVINNVTIVAAILTGAALIREREHGTVEHLLVMPVTPLEIMLAKVWSMALVVLAAVLLALFLVIRGALHIPLQGSVPLFMTGVALHLFAATSMGILMATVARSMPQFGMLLILTLLPLQMLSGSITPRESMPQAAQQLMLLAPTTHFVELAQAILYRGAGIDVVWRPFLALLTIGAVLFWLALVRFRQTIAQMA